MRVMVPVVAVTARRVNGDVDGDLMTRGDLPGEVQGEIATLISVQLDRQRDLEFAGNGRVLPGL
ncbi:hypothetical protein D3C73_1318870 [compost metagenome]